MKLSAPKFSIRDLFLLVAFISIALGAGVGIFGIAEARSPNYPLRDYFRPLVFSAPYWIPCVFAAYALGRRKLSWGTFIVFGCVEAVSTFVTYQILYDGWLKN
jgi:hypothetical protein